MTKLSPIILLITACWFAGCGKQNTSADGEFKTVSLQSEITAVQPMTGLVFWESLDHKDTDAIQLEFSYLRYSDVVKEKGNYDWSIVEQQLAGIASRKHQAVLRFWDTYPGRESGVPDYIKALPDYKNVVEKSENRDTEFPDWSHPEYQRFILEFFETLAQTYDNDPRLAFLEVGFGLWSEYHIYDPGERMGENFPSKAFQSQYFRHLDTLFHNTPWMISQDAHVANRTPFASDAPLLDLQFGIFDDSFHLAWEPGYNLGGWEFFGLERFKRSPMGGEILFPNKERSDFVDAGWAEHARQFGITFMITEQWLRWIGMDRVKENSMACGYRFRVTSFEASDTQSRVTVENTGAAPIYYDAFVAINGVRSAESLKHLVPGESRQFTIESGGKNPTLRIECDRLVPGQEIGFEANLVSQ